MFGAKDFELNKHRGTYYVILVTEMGGIVPNSTVC